MDDYISNKHYITVDDRGHIVDGWSDGPHPEKDTTGAICINEQGGYQFRLLVTFSNIDGEPWHQQTEENPALWDMDGIPLYKYEDGEVLERTQEEMDADRAALPKPEDKPSPEQRIAELETGKADRADLEDIWEQMAGAYREGVQQA